MTNSEREGSPVEALVESGLLWNPNDFETGRHRTRAQIEADEAEEARLYRKYCAEEVAGAIRQTAGRDVVSPLDAPRKRSTYHG